MRHIMQLAKLLQENSGDEAGAMEKYTELLMVYKEAIHHIDESDPVYATLKEQMDQVIEFISDEQNHLKTLQEMYITLTHITPSKD